MKTRHFFWLTLLVAVLLGEAAYCKDSSGQGKPADIDYYTCTMHPSVRSKIPGKCPICGMDLVPVMKKGAASTNLESTEQPTEFIVPIERQQQIGVRYGAVEKQPFVHTVRVVGTVADDKQRRWDYVARVEGYVSKLFVSSPGEPVEKDAPLLTIYSPDLLTAQSEFSNLLKTRDDAKAKNQQAVIETTENLIDAAKGRLRLWNITDDQITELEKTRQPQETLTLYSPFKGIVQELPVNQGQRVVAGDRLASVMDLSVVWVWAQFYQDDLPMLKQGLPITISASSYPGEKFDGKISVIDPFVSDASRTARVRVDVENPESKLRPGMYVDAELTMDMGEGLAVPADAVLPTGEHNIVFVNRGGGKLQPRFIELGRKYGDAYEVKSGLKEGEQVVTSANFLIDAEAKVQGALKSW
ncbi:MAG TPA: efflux RND transporter periplasmic adaptor subunit [Verrucomicrobiae bacterium]|nr:efflux RND transporter periplasmic adaptor subunit [Verrucomicrobiae bacterium]